MSQAHALDAVTRRLLKSLSAHGVWLEQATATGDADVVYRLRSNCGVVLHEDVRIAPDVLSQAAQRGWLI